MMKGWEERLQNLTVCVCVSEGALRFYWGMAHSKKSYG